MSEDSLPPGWATACLSDLVESDAPIVYGILQPGPDIAHGVPYIRPTEIDKDQIQAMELRNTSQGIANRYARSALEGNDIILSIVGTIGKVALVPMDLRGANITQSSARIRVRKGLMPPRYAAWALRSPALRRQFGRSRLGTAVPRLNLAHVRELLVPVAPLAEQRRIVAKIEELFSELDAGVAALERVRANLKRYRAAVLKAAVEGKLTAEWRGKNPDVEPASKLLERILAERRKGWEEEQLAKYKAKGKPSPKGWKERYNELAPPDTTCLPKLPGGWCWATAEQVCRFITKGTTPPRGKLGASGEIPFIKVYNLTHTGALDFSVNPTFISRKTHTDGGMRRSRVYPNDVLMNIVGPPLGKISIVPSHFPEWNVNQAIAILRPLIGVRPSFLCNLLLSDSILQRAIRKGKATAGQRNLTLEIVRDLPLPLVPQHEQDRIVAAIDGCLTVAHEAEVQLDHALQRGICLRSAILRSAFKGELVPQDPCDEPASKLLERIRGEREAASKNTRRKPRRTRKKEKVQ